MMFHAGNGELIRVGTTPCNTLAGNKLLRFSFDAPTRNIICHECPQHTTCINHEFSKCNFPGQMHLTKKEELQMVQPLYKYLSFDFSSLLFSLEKEVLLLLPSAGREPTYHRHKQLCYNHTTPWWSSVPDNASYTWLKTFHCYNVVQLCMCYTCNTFNRVPGHNKFSEACICCKFSPAV
jgi:hypothetical protein